MNVSKPRPGDQSVLIIFVLGGVTLTELRQIKEAVSASKTNVQVSIAYQVLALNKTSLLLKSYIITLIVYS